MNLSYSARLLVAPEFSSPVLDVAETRLPNVAHRTVFKRYHWTFSFLLFD